MSAITTAGLGRVAPVTDEHIRKYPVRAFAGVTPSFTRVPVVLGINWYRAFDRPELDRATQRFWIGGIFDRIDGGHAIAVDNGQLPDRDTWYHFYDQGALGACVGFSMARVLTQWNHGLFDARDIWDRAKLIDGFSDTNPGDNEGTTLDAGARVLALEGPRPWDRLDSEPRRDLGFGEYRWATTVDEVLAALDSPSYSSIGGVPLLNSWGEAYPRVVWLELDGLARLLAENGEALVPSRRRPA